MAISSAQANFGMSAAGTATRPLISGVLTVGHLPQAMRFDDADIAFTGLSSLSDTQVATVPFADLIATPTSSANVAASVTLEPTGTDNDLLLTAKTAGVAGNDLTSEVVIVADSTDLTVEKSAGKTTVTSGDKRRMIVTGELTSDGVSEVTFEPLVFHSMSLAKITYMNEGFPGDGESDGITGDGGITKEFIIIKSGVVLFKSLENAASPDLVTTWVPEGSATGTPVVTAATATASQAIALDQSALSVTIANAAGSDGTGALATAAQASLTGGITRQWDGASVDYQGDAFTAPSEILGILINCKSGEATILIDAMSIVVSAGEKLQIGNPAGIFDTTETLTITSSDDDTEIEVAVIAKS